VPEPTRIARRRLLLPLASVLAPFSWSGRARATSPEVAAVCTRVIAELGRWAQAQRVTLSAAVLDGANNQELAVFAPHAALNPASNQKLLTLIAAFDALGPAHRFTASVHGRISQGGVAGELVLRSDGHPELGVDDLERFARESWALGLRQVQGDVWVDHSAFDANWEPPAYEQRPNDWAAYRAPVSAVAVEGNTLTLRVLAQAAGESARVWFDPPGQSPSVQGSIATGPTKSARDVRFSVRSDAQGGLEAHVGGSIPESSVELSVARRLANPELVPGKAFIEVLKARGISVGGAARSGGANVEARLWSVTSRPLSQIAHALGKSSDNFVAEMLLKALGRSATTPVGSSAAGARAIEAFLDRVGARTAETRITNGSGLFDANRVSASSLSRALGAALHSPRIAPELIASLAIGGVDGTLRNRFEPFAAARSIRAKTGTLADTVALSGYVLPSGAQAPLVFSMLINQAAGKTGAARQRLDHAVSEIARALP